MAWALIDEDAVGFSDGGSGHVYTFPAGAPNPGEWDVIFLNSNTVLASTPSGWTRALDLIANFGANNQGAYCLIRKAVGGESDSVTITTSGNFNACLNWSRWTGGDALDVATAAVADANQASTTPPISTGPLTSTGELVLACAALQGAFTTITPNWTAGYTQLAGVQYNAGPLDEVSSYTAYKTDAGTASESPQADWTSTPAAPVQDRYIMVVTFTPADEGQDASGEATTTGGASTTAAGSKGAQTTPRTTAGNRTAADGTKHGAASPGALGGSTLAADGTKDTAGEAALPSGSRVAVRGSRSTSGAPGTSAGAAVRPAGGKGFTARPRLPGGASTTTGGAKGGIARPRLAAGGSLVAAEGLKTSAGTSALTGAGVLRAASGKHVIGTCRMGAAVRLRPSAPGPDTDVDITVGPPQRIWSAGAPSRTWIVGAPTT